MAQIAWAQKKAEAILTKWADRAPAIDGQLNDWNDSLDHYNNTAKLYYSLTNDNENIYLAIKNNSRENLMTILATGISFSANIESNKKNPPKVTFPIVDRTPVKSVIPQNSLNRKSYRRKYYPESGKFR